MGSSKELRDSSNGTVPSESRASSGKQSDALSGNETITVDPPKAGTSFFRGMRDAIPIGLGYLAVSFSLGIAAGNADFSIAQGFWLSTLNVSSSGQYAGIVLIQEHSTIIELILMILIANARYMLMSCALSQKLDPDMPFFHRLLIGYGVTDEIFGLEIAVPGYVKPRYVYGAMMTAIPGWAIGTCLGVFMGNVMPPVFAEAMNVAIFGMFLAIIIPPSKTDKIAGIFVLLGFICSFLASVLPVISGFSSGTRILILTVVLSTAAALLFPIKESTPEEAEEQSEAFEARGGER